MVPSLSISPRVEEARYLALLRAANAIATTRDCDSAADTLLTELREVTPFDSLHLVAFDKDTNAPHWSLLEGNGKRVEARAGHISIQNNPIQWVYDSGRPLVTADWRRETRFELYGKLLSELGIASTCTLPLVPGDRRLGVLSLGRSYPHAYDEEEVRFLVLVAEQIGLAIDAAVNFYLSERAQDQLKLILDLTNQVVSNLEFDDLLHATSATVRKVMRCDAAAIMLADAENRNLRVHALDYPDSRGVFVEGLLVPIEGTMPGNCFKSGKPMVVNRLDPAEIPPEMYRKATAEGLNSFCDIPLLSKNRLLGVLAVARREENTFVRCLPPIVGPSPLAGSYR